MEEIRSIELDMQMKYQAENRGKELYDPRTQPHRIV